MVQVRTSWKLGSPERLARWRVGEEADQALDLGMAAAGDRHADDEVFQSAVLACEEDTEAGEQRHEERRRWPGWCATWRPGETLAVSP